MFRSVLARAAAAGSVGVALSWTATSPSRRPAFADPVRKDSSSSGAARYFVPSAEDSSLKIFSGNANKLLANEVAMHLGVSLGRRTLKRYADGEVSVQLLDNVRGKDVYVVQPLAPPTNESLMELLLLVTTLRRSSARTITAVVPYYGYSRPTPHSPKEDDVPIAGADVAKMLLVAGIDRVVSVDLHHNQIQAYFGNVPVDNLDVSGIALPHLKNKFLVEPVVVSPDANGAARAKRFRDRLIKAGTTDASLAIIIDLHSKKRGWAAKENAKKGNSDWTDEEIDAMNLVGDVEGKDCIVVDDIIDTAGRVTRAAAKLKKAGARRVFAYATHGLFLGDAFGRIERSELVEVVCVNTVPLDANEASSKIQQLSIGGLVAETIRRIHENESVSEIGF